MSIVVGVAPRPGIDYCKRCNNRSRKPRPGKTTCKRCVERIAASNKRRRAYKREWEQRYDRARGIRPVAEVKLSERIVWLEREVAALRWAGMHGRVPTFAELADIIGVPSLALVSARGGSPRYIGLRREWFGLRPNVKQQAIPYPVPAKYRKDTQ